MRCPTLAELPSPPPGKCGWPWTEETPRLSGTLPDGRPWPEVSIVTPSYNQGQFIEETIRSVLLQGYPDLEYTVIDGGSTDASVEIIRKYEPWLAYWVSEGDRGQGHAINKGWARAHGQIIAYLNSDDMLAPGTLRTVAKTFSTLPDVAVVYGDRNLVDDERRLIQRLGSRNYSRANLLLADYIHQASAFVRRGAFECVGMVDESFHLCMDYDYWLRLALAGFDMVYVARVLSSTRLSGGTKTARLSVQFLEDTLRILNAVYGRADVPADVRRVKRAAYGNAWRLGGVRYFDAGMRRQAITSMLKSLGWDPLPGWKPFAVAWLVILQAVLGVHWRSIRTLEKAGPT